MSPVVREFYGDDFGMATSDQRAHPPDRYRIFMAPVGLSPTLPEPKNE
jgi:hypothetical protein